MNISSTLISFVMEIEYSSKKLKKTLESDKLLRTEFGLMTKKIQMAMYDLNTVSNMQDIKLMEGKYKLHWLEGQRNNQMSMIIKLPFCLIIEPMNFETREFSKIDKIKIIGIENYHEK